MLRVFRAVRSDAATGALAAFRRGNTPPAMTAALCSLPPPPLAISPLASTILPLFSLLSIMSLTSTPPTETAYYAATVAADIVPKRAPVGRKSQSLRRGKQPASASVVTMLSPVDAAAVASIATAAATGSVAQVEVYGPQYSCVYRVPLADVSHMPPEHLQLTRLVLCGHHLAASGSCGLGSDCKFVHADLSRATVLPSIHINYAYRSLDDVEYSRFAPGYLLRVSQPNGKAPVAYIPSECCLRTRANVAHHRQLSHCAHYYYNRTCHLGDQCQFVHAVYVDPAATRHQRAPAARNAVGAASAAGGSDGSSLGGSVQATPRSLCPVGADSLVVTASNSSVDLFASSPSCVSDRLAMAATPPTTPFGSSSLLLPPLSCRQQCLQAAAMTSVFRRYRHEPYDFTSAMVPCA